MLTVGSLFAGIGGFDLGLERAGMKVIWQCERDPYCKRVLRKHWDVPIYDDITTLRGCDIERPWVLAGGFPCQPTSHAGLRLGAEDNRWLWPEYLRLVEELRPAWVLGENVVGIVSMGLDNVLADLEGIGYATRAFDIPACAAGAIHQRRRIFIVAHAEWDEQLREESCDGEDGRMGREFQPFPWNRDWESTLREFRGMDDGLSYGVDRTDTLRNAIVPQIAEIIGRAIVSQHDPRA